MPIQLSAKLHGLFSSWKQDENSADLKQRLLALTKTFERYHLLHEDDRTAFVVRITKEALERLGQPSDHTQMLPLAGLLLGIIDDEDMFVLPTPGLTSHNDTAEKWAMSDAISKQEYWISEFVNVCEALRLLMCHVADTLLQASPIADAKVSANDISIPTNLLYAMSEPQAVVERLCRICAAEELQELSLLQNTQRRLEHNLIAASGGNPRDPSSFNKAAKYPSKSGITNPQELIQTYLGATPLVSLFDQDIPFVLSSETRFEHHHIVAGSGHGKTQTLQYLIAEDLKAVADGQRSLVVIDSQGDLIKNISQLADFAPGGALHDRVVIIDPTDVEYPVALNLFDVGQDRLNAYSPLEQERLTNSILELYDFVLGSLLSAEMTQKQNVIFRYVTRLMLHIPNATIHTLRDLMEPNGSDKFQDNINQLTGSAKHFFDTEFNSREFDQTKKQVLRRLWGILENQTFERMFTHPRSKLDLFAEMNSGKVILINTAKDLLKEGGTEIFGRFFIALIAQAAQERATLPVNKRMPTYVYVDEAADYFDRNIGVILSQARKYGIGMVLAHQFLGQLDPKLAEAISANTSIKFAGGLSFKDARTMSAQLRCDAQMIEQLPKGTFAASVRGSTKTAVPLSFPFGHLESLPRMNAAERRILQDIMRERHSVHYADLGQGVGLEDVHGSDVEEAAPDNDSNQPTPQW